MKNKLIFLSSITIFLFLVGCAAESPSPMSATLSPEEPIPDTQPSEVDPASGYPASDEAYPSVATGDLGYPGGQQTESSRHLSLATEMLPIPEPLSSETGTVTGVLKLRSVLGSDPVPEAILYLGSIVTLDDGRPALGAINKQIAPNTQTNYTGQFIFENVSAGQYVIAFDRVTTTFVLNSPSGGDFIIDVNGGEILDLGELIYSDLPVPESK